MNTFTRLRQLLSVALLSLFLQACATVEGPTDPEDPFESFNRAMYTFNDTLDKAVLKPVAKGYNAVLPDPVNKGVSNFFSNLDDVVVIFNDLLQLKIERALSDTARLFFNSTIGLFGFVDVASAMEFPKHNEDLGQSFGYWGIGTGPYLVLPILGPSDIRDTVGLIGDAYVDPLNDINPNGTRTGLTLLEGVDTRAGLLSASKVLKEAALDEYLFTRDAYLQRRESLVYDGNPPKRSFDY